MLLRMKCHQAYSAQNLTDISFLKLTKLELNLIYIFNSFKKGESHFDQKESKFKLSVKGKCAIKSKFRTFLNYKGGDVFD